MFVIFGTRPYGRIDDHDGEHQVTRFGHLWYVPIIPLGSYWVMGEAAVETPLRAKSLLAGYARVTAPAVAGLLLVGIGPFSIGAALLCAAPLLVLSALAWTWRALPASQHRRSDFNRAAFGTRCEPRFMPAGLRAEVKAELERLWDARKPSKSPNDVADHGATDANEAVIAYGLLRLAGVEHAAEDAAADRILDGAQEPTAVGDGPYRTAMPGAADPVALVDAAAPLSVPGAPPLPPATPPTYVPRGKDDARNTLHNARLGLAVATVLGLGGAGLYLKYSTAPVVMTAADIQRVTYADAVRVHCDAFEPAWTESNGRGEETQIALCLLGDKVLPVKVNALPPSGTGATVLEGSLRPLPSTERWVTEGYNVEPELAPARLNSVLDDASHRAAIRIVGAIFAVLGGVAWVVYGFWRHNVRLTKKRMAARAARGTVRA